jgi:hypothetical protein
MKNINITGINVMSNPWLPGLLRQLSKNQLIKTWQYDDALKEAAAELEKLERIEKALLNASKEEIFKILSETTKH